MRKSYFLNTALTFVLAICAFIWLTPQTAIASTPSRDTIHMESSRTHDAYYSLKTGEEFTMVRDNWDIEFSTAIMDVAIRTNGPIGVKLYTYPNTDITGWENIDTTGLSTWPIQYNNPTDWELGAFNINTTGSQLDFGWGVYNMTTHHIVGDSLFVIGLPDGSYKKLWIIEKNPLLNEYSFKYANLDGTEEIEVLLECNGYSTKNFVGFKFSNNEFIDREPESNTWDLQFTKFMTFYGGEMWYGVTGVLQNYNVQVAAYAETDTSFVDYNITTLDSNNISTIGNNWYSLQGGMPPTYVLEDSLVYFVSDRESSIWKVVFEYYESGAGEIGFRKQLLEDHSGISEVNGQTTSNLAIHPNPSSGNPVHLLFNSDKNDVARLSIYNLLGAKIFEENLNVSTGLNDHILDISSYPLGAYLIIMEADNVVLKSKLIRQ